MAQLLSNLESTEIPVNLDTYNYIVPEDGMYTIDVRMTDVPPCGVSIAVDKNGSLEAASTDLSNNQNHVSMIYTMSVVIDDVIGVTISAPTGDDSEDNSAEGILSITQEVM